MYSYVVRLVQASFGKSREIIPVNSVAGAIQDRAKLRATRFGDPAEPTTSLTQSRANLRVVKSYEKRKENVVKFKG